MSSRRTLIVIVAVVIGAIASFALFRYVGSVEEEAYGNARRVEVLVVKKDIPKGTSGIDVIRDNFVGKALIPQEIRPATALTSSAGLESLVAVGNLAANQVIVDGMFVTPEQAFASDAERIQDGRVAITISVDQVRGVANLVRPGDKVNMIIRDPESVDPANPEVGGGDTTFLYQNVEVLAIGSQLTPDLGEVAAEDPAATGEPVQEVASNLMTLTVPPEAALKVAHVPSESVYLTLVPPDNTPVRVPPVNNGNLLEGGLTPYPDEEGL